MKVDPSAARRLKAEGLGTRRIAQTLGVSRHAVRAALAGGAQSPSASTSEPVSVTLTDEGASVVLPAGASLGDLDDLLRERGLDPADWHVERVTVNEWDALANGGGPDGEPKIVKLRQLKAALVRRSQVLFPAVEVAERYRPERDTSKVENRLVVSLSDQHAPYHDPELHRAVLRWLSDVRPDEIVLAGDTLDLPNISRHRDRPYWNAGVQESADAGYRVLSDYCDASPDSRRRKLLGNHDWRLESEMMGRAERMAFVRPAKREGEDEEDHLLSVRRILHLDALGIELVGREGDDWRFGEVKLGPALSVRHEPPSGVKTARLNRNVIAGHTHRQMIRHVTMIGEDDESIVRTVVESGCLARTPEGLGYAPNPDWQAGFATVAIYGDGEYHFDLASWRNGSLTWRGEQWKGGR